MELKTLDAIGYKNQQVPNTFVVQSNPTEHLGIILPGYRHSADMADLHYVGRILMEQGADLLRVEYLYYQTNYLSQSESDQNQRISEDVFAVCNACLAFRPYDKITLVGKSLGTKGMGFLLGDERFQKANCVWSTPPLTTEWLYSRIEQVRPPSLFIFGTADDYYNPEKLSHLVDVTNGRAVIIEGANHGLEVPESIPASLQGLGQIVQGLQEFLGSD
jgi:predicted alpha/beta-hydrolase family hydrolase